MSSQQKALSKAATTCLPAALYNLLSLYTQLIAARSAFASTRGGASATVANKLGDDGLDDDFVRCSTPVAAASGLIGGPSFLFPFGVIWPPPAFLRSSLSFARCNRASAARVARPAETGGRSAFGSRE